MIWETGMNGVSDALSGTPMQSQIVSFCPPLVTSDWFALVSLLANHTTNDRSLSEQSSRPKRDGKLSVPIAPSREMPIKQRPRAQGSLMLLHSGDS
jgi:hypothetical protein